MRIKMPSFHAKNDYEIFIPKSRTALKYVPDEPVIDTEQYTITQLDTGDQFLIFHWGCQICENVLEKQFYKQHLQQVPCVCKLSTTHKGKKELPVIPRCITSNHMLQGLVVHICKFSLYIVHVNFCSSSYNPD